MPADPEIHDLLRLALVPGLGPRLTTALLNRFGNAASVCRAAAAELRSVPHIGAKLSDNFVTALAKTDVSVELRLLEQHAVELLRLGEADYPPRLAQIADAPHLLFVRGDIW